MAAQAAAAAGDVQLPAGRGVGRVRGLQVVSGGAVAVVGGAVVLLTAAFVALVAVAARER